MDKIDHDLSPPDDSDEESETTDPDYDDSRISSMYNGSLFIEE